MSSRMGLVTSLLEEQLAAAKAGDEEAVRVLHEAVGRLVELTVCTSFTSPQVRVLHEAVGRLVGG
jgi:hypothetical protein